MDFFEFETAASVAVYVLCGGFAMWTLVNTIDAVRRVRNVDPGQHDRCCAVDPAIAPGARMSWPDAVATAFTCIAMCVVVWLHLR